MDFYKKTAFIGLVLIAVLLGACASQEGPVSTEITLPTMPPSVGEKTQEQASPEEVAVDKLARQLGIDPAGIEVVSLSPMEWPNSCLGIPTADEMCLDVITPGYRGILEANGVKYELRSDERAEQIRFIPGAALAAQSQLAQKLGISSEIVRLVSFEQMMWRDSCLGVQMPNQACLDVITPGFRVVLQVEGQQYIYHTDEAGDNLVLAENPQDGSEEPVIIWSLSDESGCQQARIGFREVSFGACDGDLTTMPMMSDMNSGDLAYFHQKYAPFEAETAAGVISFRGDGDQEATQTEQRMIAEWAKLTRQVVEAGRAGAAWGLALAWHREGGIAGFCDDLVIYMYGIALASSCQLEESMNTQRIYLNADQLERLYGWVDSLSSFEYEQTDPGTADAMRIYMEFVGNGDSPADGEVQAEILNFAAEIFTQASGSQSTD